MKYRREAQIFRFSLLAIVALCAIATGRGALAATWYWDTNGSTAGAGGTPTATWATSGTTWSSSASGTATISPYSTLSSDDLYFVAGPSGSSGNANYTVTVSGVQDAQSLNLQSSGVATITSGTVRLWGGGISLPTYAFGTTRQAAGTIASALSLQAAQTWTNSSTSTLTVSGQITGNQAVAVKGPGVFALTSSATNAATFTIGDVAPTGSLGGRVTGTSQANLGTGNYTLAYGGYLSIGGFGAGSPTFSPTNNVTVNAGGRVSYHFNDNAISTPTGLLALSNLAEVDWLSSFSNSTTTGVNYTIGTTLTVPNAGAVYFNGGGTPNDRRNRVTVTGAYPSLAASLAIGGQPASYGGFDAGSTGQTGNFNRVDFTGTTTVSTSDGVARTLALNVQGLGTKRQTDASAGALFFGGFLLNADMGVKGSGNSGLASPVVPTGVNSLGVLSGSTARTLSVAMSPVGSVAVSGSGNTGVGAVTVSSGWLGIATTPNGRLFPNASRITLDGGGFNLLGSGTVLSGTISDPIFIGPRGGSLAAVFLDEGQGNYNLGASGAITGSGPLTLIAGRNWLGNPSNSATIALTLSGSNAGYTGPITVGRTGGYGVVFFSGTASGGSANTITAPNGTIIGFDAIATATSMLPRFVVGSETVLVAGNANRSGWLPGGSATLNLSNAGSNPLNFPGRIGLADFTISGSITPYDASGYRFALVTGNLNLFSTANVLTGANAIDISRAANAPQQANANGEGGANALFSSSQSASGGFSVGGMAPALYAWNAGMTENHWNRPSDADVRIVAGGDLPNVASVNVRGLHQLSLSGTTGRISSTAGGAGLPVTVQTGALLQIGDTTTAANNNGVTNRLGGGTARVTLGGTGGGFIDLAYGSSGSTSETFGSLTVAPGNSRINTGTSAAGSLALTIASGSIGRTGTGGSLYLPFPTVSFPGLTLAGAASTSGTAVAGWMFIPRASGNITGSNGVTFAAIDGNSRLVPVVATVNNINTANADIVVNGSAGANYTLAANTTVNTITIETGSTVSLGTNVLTVARGGIISNNSAPTISASGAGGITSGFNSELIVGHFVSSNLALTISAPIRKDAGGNNISFTMNGLGTLATQRDVVLSSGSNAIGDVWISGAPLRIQTGVGSLGIDNSSSNTVTLQNGSLFIDISGSTTFNQRIVSLPLMRRENNDKLTSPLPANAHVLNMMSFQNAGQVTTFTGPVQVDGPLHVLAGGLVGKTVVLSGSLTGAALLGAGAVTRDTLVLGGSNTGFSGGVLMASGLHLRLENPAAAGSGVIRGDFAQGVAGLNRNPSLYLGTGAAGIGLSQDVLNLGTIVDWNLGGSLTATGTVQTISGAVYTTRGLTFQGRSSGAAVSETVLAGKVSVNGSPQAYNFSTTPTTSVQNFVNLQGGINLGVTDYLGTVQLTGTGSTASNFAIDAAGGGVVSTGAAGFVRFAGADSFLPGNAGPGYIAAIGKAGAGTDGRFGYLVTTGTANGGSTYVLPEGKGFVIGSLGSGAQVAGVLGGAGSGTATLLGGPKAAAGQTMTGFSSGDLNIHANAATDTQSLTLLARDAATTLVVGSTASPVVFMPTYGDSGWSNAMTLLAKRTGATTLIKDGAGTLALRGLQYTHADGTDASASFGWTVQQGTLDFDSVASLDSTSGIGIAAGAILGYTGTAAGTLSRNITVASSGTGTIRNSGGQKLTLSGVLTKDGRVLRLTGGQFDVTGQIVGSSANSDLLVDGTSTVTLLSANTYNGPTFVNQASTLILGTNSAIPSNSIVTLGNATTRGTLDLGSFTNAIGGLVFSGSGGTVRMAANQTSAVQLSSTSGLTLGSNASLDLTGMQTSAGRYQLISYTSNSGTFGSVTGLANGYQLVYGATQLDAQQQAVLGAVTVTNPASAIITGGSANFTYTVANSALSGGASLSFTGAGASNVAGSSSGSAGAASTSSSVSGLYFNGVTTGTGRTGTFTVSAPNAYGSTSTTGTVSVDVYDHAAGSATGTTIALADSIVGYTGSLSGLTSATISNASGYRVNLMTTGGTSAGFVNINNVSGIGAGSSATISAVAALNGTQTSGSNSLGQTFSLTYADNSSLAGASNNLGSQAITVTGNVYDHASGSLSGGTIRVADSIVGYSSGLTGLTSATVSNAAGYRVNLKTLGTTSAGGVTINNVSGIAANSSSTISASVVTGTATGANAVNQTFNLTYADDSTLAGASNNVGSTSVTVQGNVYDHASGSATGTTIALADSIVGYTGSLTGLTSATISNASGYRVNLMTTGGTSAGFVNINNVSGIAAGSTGLISAAASLNGTQTVGSNSLGQSFNLTYADNSALAGASSNLGSQSIVVTGNVLDHATPGFLASGITNAYTDDVLNINFGSIDETAGTQNFTYNLLNLASQTYGPGLTAGLAFTGVTADGNGFASGLSTFNNLIGGGTSSLFTLTFAPTGQGTFSKSFTLSFTDNQSLAGYAARRNLTINAHVIVVPEPGAIALAGIGIAAAAYALRRRRR
jgi:hypothetical protein